MPDMDGYQLVEELRNRPRTVPPAGDRPDRPRPQQDVERALPPGFHAHVGKPVDMRT